MRAVPLLLLLFASCASTGSSAPPPSAPPHDHAHAGPIGHRFEDAEAWAKVFDDPSRDAWQRPDEVVTLLRLEPGMTVADVGAGTGYFIGRLAAKVGERGRVLALDIEPDMVRYLEARAAREGLKNVSAGQVKPDDPGLPAGAIHRVLIVDTWHHIADRVAYSRKLAAGLAPDGEVMVVDFTLDAKIGPPKHHRIAPEKVIEELRAGGLQAEVVSESLPEQYIVVGRRP